VTQDPYLAALLEEYGEALDRLRRSFVGPKPIELPGPLSPERFAREYPDGEPWVRAFRTVEEHAAQSSGRGGGADPAAAYSRYREWFPFAYLQRLVLDRVADALGYDAPRTRV
jgi:hypothetical protein